ncbi:methyltransferase family protein [Victivallis sp.]|uniref:methyltransferase family protein n=1 Tax=Victivallis sp. TaxID=2049020 RepID=UPI003A921122
MRTELFQQIRAILVLPFTVTVVIPTFLWFTFTAPNEAWKSWLLLPALLLGGVGLWLLCWTITLLVRVGKGTLAPWNPTRKLVVCGPYAHVRNPMLSGVFMILLAEAIGAQSGAIALWFLLFVLINAVYFVYSEEPGLRKRFGAEYEEYCRHVPRYLPRLTPWKP